MFAAWFITIGLFLICIAATYAIIDGVHRQDEEDLANLQSQLKNMAIHNNTLSKQAV